MWVRDKWPICPPLVCGPGEQHTLNKLIFRESSEVIYFQLKKVNVNNNLGEWKAFTYSMCAKLCVSAGQWGFRCNPFMSITDFSTHCKDKAKVEERFMDDLNHFASHFYTVCNPERLTEMLNARLESPKPLRWRAMEGSLWLRLFFTYWNNGIKCVAFLDIKLKCS